VHLRGSCSGGIGPPISTWWPQFGHVQQALELTKPGSPSSGSKSISTTGAQSLKQRPQPGHSTVIWPADRAMGEA
jgi:hypothetical protein